MKGTKEGGNQIDGCDNNNISSNYKIIKIIKLSNSVYACMSVTVSEYMSE